MTDHKIQFFSFDEAVQAARSDPGTELVGIKFDEPFTYLAF